MANVAPVDRAAEPRLHTVFLYATAHIKVPGISATSHREAMEIATRQVDLDRLLTQELSNDPDGVTQIAYAEEITAYLVDEAGDPEYSLSRTYDGDMDPDEGGHQAPDAIQPLLASTADGTSSRWVATYLASSVFAHLRAADGLNGTSHVEAARRFFKALSALAPINDDAHDAQMQLCMDLSAAERDLLHPDSNH